MRVEFLEDISYLTNLFECYKIEVNIIDHSFETFNGIWSLDSIDIDIEEFDKIVNIINKIVSGDRSFIRDIKCVKIYFVNNLNKFKNEHNNRRNWRYRYPELYGIIYEIEEDIMYTLEQLLLFLNVMSPFELFEIMTLKEEISLQNMCNEKHLPYDIQRYIGHYIGF